MFNFTSNTYKIKQKILTFTIHENFILQVIITA